MESLRLLFPEQEEEEDAIFRASLDSEGDSHDHDRTTPTPTPTRTLPPPLSLPTADESNALLWNLISPCSEPPTPTNDANDMDEIGLVTECHSTNSTTKDQDTPEPEASPTADAAWKQQQQQHTDRIMAEDDERYASSSDSEDDEVEVFNAEALTLKQRSGSLQDGKTDSDKLDSVTEADELDEVEVSSTASSLLFDDSTSEDGSVVSRPSLVAAGGKWVGRMKARTYSGPVTITQAYQKMRARTLSATSTLRQGRSRPYEDDGDFSSDDEDSSRTSMQLPTSRHTSLSFPTRLSTVKNVKLPTSVPAFLRFRSSSSTTTTSEDSFIGTTSLPNESSAGGLSHGESMAPSSGGIHYNTQKLKQKASALSARAAGLLNAASAEAARKLKTTRAFRSASQSSASSAAFSMANSPVVDVVECSQLPLHPNLAAASS